MFIYLDWGNSFPCSRSKLGCTKVLSNFMPVLVIPKLNFRLSNSRCLTSGTRVLYLVLIVTNVKLGRLCLRAMEPGKNRARQSQGGKRSPGFGFCWSVFAFLLGYANPVSMYQLLTYLKTPVSCIRFDANVAYMSILLLCYGGGCCLRFKNVFCYLILFETANSWTSLADDEIKVFICFDCLGFSKLWVLLYCFFLKKKFRIIHVLVWSCNTS